MKTFSFVWRFGIWKHPYQKYHKDPNIFSSFFSTAKAFLLYASSGSIEQTDFYLFCA